MDEQQEVAAACARFERHMAEAAISPAAWPLPGGYRPAEPVPDWLWWRAAFPPPQPSSFVGGLPAL